MTDDAPKRLRRSLIALTVLPIVVAVIRALRHHWFPIGDNALLYIRVVDVVTEHHPWLGSWTSASLSVGENMNNPGPIYADLVAPFAKVFGPGPGAAIGVGVLNVLAIIGILAVARRIGGWAIERWALLAAAGLSWSMGSEMLFDIWQAHSLLLPFLLLLVLLVGVTDGQTWCIPWSLAMVSLLVHTHISYAYILAVLCPVAAVSYWLVRRRRPHLPWSDAIRARPVIVSFATLALIWSQTFYEQFFGSGKGNLSRLLGNAGGGSLQVGNRSATGISANLFTLPPWWIRSGFSTSVPNTPLTYGPGNTAQLVIPSLPNIALAALSLVVLVGVLAALAVHHRRRDTHLLGNACIMAAAGVVGSVVAISRLTVGPVGLAAHHVRFLWPLAVFVHVALIATLGHHLAVRVAHRPRAVATLRWGPVGVAAVLAVAAVPYHAQPQGPVAFYSSMSTLRRVLPHLDQLAAVQPVLYDVSNVRPFEPYSSTVMMQLQELDIQFRVTDEIMIRQLGESRRADGTEPATIFQLQGAPAVLYDGPACRIALASELAEAEEGVARKGAAQLAEQVASGEITVADSVLRDADAAIEPVLRLAQQGDLDAARTIVYEGYLSRWYTNGEVQTPDDLATVFPVIDTFLNTAYALFSDQSQPCP